MEIEILVLLISIFIGYLDSTLGMGYGTIMTPTLLLIGFAPFQIVPTVLLSQFLSGIIGAILHHEAKNVSFDFNCDSDHKIVKRLGKLGYIPKSIDSKIAALLMISGIIGVYAAISIAKILPIFYLKLYIGLLIILTGIIIIARYKTQNKFSWKKVTLLGIIASFNKGISGGGYGPIIVSGQILSGVKTRNTVGITVLAKGFTSFIGAIGYLLIKDVDWKLAPYLIIGSLISIPLAVYTLKKISVDKSTLTIGIITVILGLFSLIKLFK